MSFCVKVLLLSVGATLALSADLVSVDTPLGTVIGSRSTAADITFIEFLGIPYAQPPVGDLRFARPLPASPFPEPFIANQFGHVCPQTLEMPFALTRPNDVMSEDCLTLNIFAPDRESEEARSVMIWIHGGAYVSGASTTYPGHVLADHGDVIVVTMNYRVGVLGFLNSGPNGLVHGNQGLLDQRMAIQWVKDNIAAFGGNPASLTIFGESAGGASVSSQSFSPLNKGLFKRAIAQSGSIFNNWAFDYRPMKSYASFVKEANCTAETEVGELECLRQCNWKPFVEHMSPLFSWSPSFDGYLLTQSPIELLSSVEAGKVISALETFSSVDYISGINSQEGLTYLLLIHMMAGEGTDLENGLSEAIMKGSLAAYLSVPERADYLAEVLTRVYEDQNPVSNDRERLTLFTRLAGDVFFGIGHFTELKLRSKLKHTGKTFSYLLDQIPDANFEEFNFVPQYTVKGSNHGEDITYLFGLPFFNPDEFAMLTNLNNYTAEERSLSRTFMTLWTNYAKTGHPGAVWEEHHVLHRSLRLAYSNGKGIGMQSSPMSCSFARTLSNIVYSSYALDAQWKPVESEKTTAPAVPGKDEL